MDDITPSKIPVGRPSKYRPEFADQAYKLCLLGATDSEVASFFDVCPATVANWKLEFPEFLESLRAGKLKADAHVASKLFERASGSEWEEEQVVKVKIGPHEDKIEIVKIRRVVPPDTAAAIMWLKNRQPAKWRDTQSLQQLDSDGNPTNSPMRVIVELVGEAAPAREEVRPPDGGEPRPPRVGIDWVG